MIHKTDYRLDRYVIAEYGTGQLWWESHVALGEQRGGKCYICGDVLILGDWSQEEDGYLSDKFFEQLEKLPLWVKTPYYCMVSDLLDVGTGQNLTNELFEKRLSLLNTRNAGPGPFTSPGEFRLGPYWITVARYNVTWHAYEESNKTVGGKCVVESNILFLGDKTEGKEIRSKQEFFNKLHLLPPWDRTIVWSRGQVLRTCHQEKQGERPRIRDIWGDLSVRKQHAARYLDHHKAAFKKLLMPLPTHLKTAWDRTFDWKACFKHLVLLAAAAMLFALVMTFHSVKKILHRDHRRKEHHHRHEDHDSE